MKSFALGCGLAAGLVWTGGAISATAEGAAAGSVDQPAGPAATNQVAILPVPPESQSWNFHFQNTDIGTYHPGFPSAYTGPNSLASPTEVRETVSVDLLFGARLWSGAEAHVDGLMWQGYGFSKTLGIEGFPSGEAFRLGARVPNVNFSRAFLRQTFGLNGETEKVADDALHLGGVQDTERVTLTLGKMSAKDIFDNNTYANDPRSQFLNWSLVANEAWDYPADSLGYITGFAAELTEPRWSWRYGFFQVPRVSNGLALDGHYLEAWAMVAESERRFTLGEHPGAVRWLAFLNRAHMGVYEAAANQPGLPPDDALAQTRDYRFKYGFGLNVEQELARDLGAFGRLGWSDGKSEAWMYSDVDHAASLGMTLKGSRWGRPDDTLAAAGVFNGLSRVHEDFIAAGGTGILAGDGQLHYGIERIVEAYYDFKLCRPAHLTLDYQYVVNPAFNQDRGPVSIFSVRMHCEF